MSAALPLHARLYSNVERGPFIDAREIARRVQTSLPRAVVDWQRGEDWVAESLEDLIAKGTPEVILAGHSHLFGKTVHISLAYPERPQRLVSTITSGVMPGSGDTVMLDVDGPFDLPLLKRAAAEFAAALDFGYCLRSNRNDVIRTVSSPGPNEPMEFLRWDMPAYIYPDVQLIELADWRATTHRAILAWIAACEYKSQIRAATDAFASHADFADAAIRELEAIDPIVRGWAVDVKDQAHQNRLLLDHGQWLTMVQFLGVSERIVG